ncbi:MAG: hypothetical protein M3125_02280 [Gemmatimonadota bacterium]|nr:hypothetical protein [Gemmatimonadota bacterium]
MPEASQFAAPERAFSYEGRRFRLTLSDGSPAARSALLELSQRGDVVTGTYAGEGVEYGSLIAVIRAMGCLEGRFHHVADGALHTGRCWGTPQHTADGRMRLYLEWHMAGREGVSVMEEIAP